MTELALLPERSGCPNCGGEGKRWMHGGRDVCSECWLDVAMDIQESNWSRTMTAIKKQEPFVPKTSRRPRLSAIAPLCANPHNGNSRPLAVGRSEVLGEKGSPSRSLGPAQRRWAPLARSLEAASYNSVCLLCGRIWYGSRDTHCKKCRGLCVNRSDHDLGLMCRHPTQFIEGNE